MATDADMDIDMNIDMDEDPEFARMQAEAKAMNERFQQQAEAEQNDAMNGIEQAPEEGELEPNAMVPTKVHLRGLDDLTTRKIEEAVREVFDTELYRRLQWIDDTSANLIYDTEAAAADALAALSAEEENEPLRLRAVKPLETLGGTQLQARMAIEADVKAPGAKDRSRFYLMNPDYDPESRPRKRKNVREHGPRYKRSRRESEDDAYHRRNSQQGTPFNVDFYDDAPAAAAASTARRVSHSSASSLGVRRQNRTGEDLFAKRDSGRLRNNDSRDRSASPDRDGDGRYGFSEEQPYRRTARQRSATPPRLRRNRENQDARLERSKELFPSRGTTSTLKSNGHAPEARRPANSNSADLFLDRTTKGDRELFPDKAVHRRHDARDIGVDEVATAIGQYNLDGTCETFTCTYSIPGPGRAGRNSKNDSNVGRDLFARVTGGPKINNGRLREGDAAQDQGFSFKGAGRDEPGFSILGASSSNDKNRERGATLAKELFPHRAGNGAPNGGKDLFDGRIKGRARKRAEDLF